MARIVIFVRPLMYLAWLLKALSVWFKFSVLILNSFVMLPFLVFLERILRTKKKNIWVDAEHLARDMFRRQCYANFPFFFWWFVLEKTDLRLLSDILSFAFHFIFPSLLARRQIEFKPTTSLFVLSKISKTGILGFQT